MPLTTKLVAVAASAVVLAGGTTAAVVTANASPAAPVAVASPAALSTTDVRVWVDGTAKLVSVPTPTVAAALSAADVTLGRDDRVSLPLEETLTPGESVTVTRVTVTEWTRDVTLDFETTRKKDATLAKGTTEVETDGETGLQRDVVRTVTVDGAIESQDVASSTVVAEPVAKVVLVGTREEPKVDSRSAERTATPSSDSSESSSASAAASSSSASSSSDSSSSGSGAGLNTANAAMWDRIAKCESGGNWAINTGNGYYGGLQFSLSTWRSVSGTDFAAYPHQASREEQITVANRLYAQRGLQPWGCRGAA